MAVVDLERIGSGRAAEVFAYAPGQIIKLLRAPGGRASLEREAAAQTAARSAGIAAPTVFGIEEIEGRTGIVMERVEGLDGLTAISRKPWTIWSVGRGIGRLHREVALVEAPSGLRSLADVVRERIVDSPRVPNAARQRLLAILDGLPEGNSLCHMDFHPGNVIETASGPVVIDFANSMRGDSLADHARSLLVFVVSEPPSDISRWERILIATGRRFASLAYKSGYGSVDRQELNRWQAVIIAWQLDDGVPEERQTLRRLLSRALGRAER